MTPRCSCGGALARDQRHCLACGAPTPLASDLRARLWAAPPPAAGAATAPPRGVDQALRGATVAFAVVLAAGAWAGARMTAPLPATAGGTVIAAAPAQAAPAAPLTPAPAATDDGDAPSPDPVAADDPALLAAAAPATVDAPTDAVADAGTAATGDAGEPAGDAGDTATGAPELDALMIVALPPLAYDAFVDPAAGAPYLAETLVPAGVLLRGFHGTAPSRFASEAALLAGQAPNAATLAGCPAVGDVTPGTIGDDEQAAGSGCRYPADAFTLADLLGATDRDHRILGDVTAGCGALPDGTPLPPARPAPLQFRSVADAEGCAGRLGTPDAAAALLTGDAPPALTWLQLDCGAAPCDAAGVDAALRGTLEGLVDRLPERSAVVLVPAHAPGEDRAACCERPWQQDAAGGRTAALVLSPQAAVGSVLDEPVDHYDLHRTAAELLGVRPLGLAGREGVTGLPAAVWATPAAAPATR